ncbi:M14 metallopeptidase family protein [uncultured Muriicola sp.]|uniref:M14 family metallopeptidase n=1 Tax=uncultured Muriicola sp. TaxID=1583102 RepID=UPI0026198176|nr:M14 metallopeptidase family protein [uncultured Muriicola sp.]
MDKDRRYEKIMESTLSGRYIHHDHIVPILKKLQSSTKIEELGISVDGLPIEKITVGQGPIKILMWSQMHGNESTTTKAVFDLINALTFGYDNAKELLERLSLVILPMLNPDGALAYTRVNANGIDLNRDAQDRTQPESKILRHVFDVFSPDFCFNLHDQRTIYSAGSAPKPATLSFLSPAADSARTVTENRLKGMNLIAAINEELQKFIPGQIGKYDDAFNANCVGDAFQMLGTPTILFEAGHFQGDYEREKTRKYMFMSLWKALELIAFDPMDSNREKAYADIPENKKYFFDILVHNAHLLNSKLEVGNAVGILYKEQLLKDSIHLQPFIDRTGVLDGYFGHLTYDCLNPQDMIRLKNNEAIANLINSSLRNK